MTTSTNSTPIPAGLNQAANDSAANPRAEWMGVLARADTASLRGHMEGLGKAPGFEWLRQPEIGAIMLQGRAGGTGAAFNMGEMTVTRCALRLHDAPASVGHGYVQGRDVQKAELAALADALLQYDARAAEVMAKVIAPLRDEEAARRLSVRRKAGATKVNFFTMVRAEG